MSIINVDSISDAAGTGSPSFPNGMSGNGSAMTNLTSANLTGALPAIDGSSLTSLTSANLTGALPAIDGSALTGIEGITQTTGSAPYYGCRAWGKVSSDALVDGGNFASWASSTNTVTFTTAMPHANYSVNCNSGAYGATFARNMTTTSFEVVVVSSGGNVGNPQNFEFTVIC